MVSHQFIIDRGENGSQSRPIIFDSDRHVLETVMELKVKEEVQIMNTLKS